MEHSSEVRDFLRTRRARITPEQAGLLPSGGPRRVPGLRREEVAQLAGVSVDYYIRLERGRTRGVSETVLDAVARALRLDDTERAHLFALAQGKPTAHARPNRPLTPQRVHPVLHRTLDSLSVPALVMGRRMDILATNKLFSALYTAPAENATSPATSSSTPQPSTYTPTGSRPPTTAWARSTCTREPIPTILN